MDEGEEGVKAPVTRLRRRMSVEQSDDGKSSSAPGTPVKKRGRKVVKPELDLIDENVAETNSKKTTKKSIAKEITDNAEEKSVTPSRRSTRIKSNTSIISDTILNLDSPRAKRAARRNSQAGSDTDTPVTPARITRRTRKDSTSSIEKEPASAIIKTTSQIPEIITEEPENITKHTSDYKTSDSESSKQSPIRKSPRLLNKKSKLDNASLVSLHDDKSSSLNDNSAATFQSDKNKSTDLSDITLHNKNEKSDITDKESISKQDYLSVSSANLIMNLETQPKKMFSHINKSLTEAQELNKVEAKRHRTKSWTTLTAVPLSNEDFYVCDNEKNKNKYGDFGKDILKNKTSDTGFGDSTLNNSKNDNDDNYAKIDISQNDINKSNSSKKKKKDKQDMSIYTSIQSDNDRSDIQSDDETANLFKKDPSNNILTTVVIEDSDSNSVQINIQNENVNEDQCVPVINHKLDEKYNDSSQINLQQPFESENNDSFKLKKSIENDTYEPMDVDETLPENLINNLPEENVFDNSQNSTNNVSNKSKRKSSLNISSSQTLEKSSKENKSTLVLSQLKDMSTSETKSPVVFINKELSNSVNVLNVTQENGKENNKHSPNYLTSTPLQQKSDGEGSNKNSNIFDSNITKHQAKITLKKKISIKSNQPKYSSENSSSDEDSSSEKKHGLLENEAVEANDSYESGDSQDDEEKQYDKDNEILEKGETLTSEDELSNDSDYEKDSFLVSSNEEDNELLSGSGDDLSMSDNELKMTSKSKKKYNERKLKEQKQASREMFESRHCSNNSSNARKSTLKINSRQRLESLESEDDIVGPKKNNRMRLNSSSNEIVNKSVGEISNRSKKSKDTSFLESSNNNLTEKEITICEEAAPNTSDPLGMSKIEQMTPKKESRCSVGFVDTELVMDTPIAKTMVNQKCNDPLENSNNEDSSSTNSEDMNIKQNYDKMLKELITRTEKSNDSVINNITEENSTDSSSLANTKVKENFEHAFAPEPKKTKKLTTGNHSLNFEKKSKKTHDHSIVDQLNITQVKEKSRKVKPKIKINETKKNKIDEADDSSDSIDLKLLFSEDSINSGDSNKKIKENINRDEDIIPLKKTKAKTNIRVDEDADCGKEEFLPFFVDTVGNQCYDNEERNNLVENNDSSNENDSNSDEAPHEISFKKHQSVTEKEDQKSPNIKNKKLIKTSVTENTENKSINETLVNNIKRKKRISESFNVSSLDVLFSQDNEIQNINEKSLNMSNRKENQSNVLNTENVKDINESINEKSNSGKKKKKALSDSLNISSKSIIEKTPTSEKKKKGKLDQSLNKSKEDSSSYKVDNEVIEQSVNKEKNKSSKNYSLQPKIDLHIEDEATTSKTKNESMKAEKFTGEGDSTGLIDSKRRKRKSSATHSFEISSGDINHSMSSNDPSAIHKKQKLSQKSEESAEDSQIKKNVTKELEMHNSKTKCENEAVAVSVNKKPKATKNLKRKNRDDDDGPKKTLKVLKENSLDQVHIPRLPTSVLNNLEDKPCKSNEKIPIKTRKVIATTEFKVEETKKRKNKPSNYLEESIYINEEHEGVKKQKAVIKKPKVLPFIPTATISNSGYTTNFKVNVLPETIEFVAQSSNVANFRNDYLYGKKIKRLGTYDLYKKNRNIKMSKF